MKNLCTLQKGVALAFLMSTVFVHCTEIPSASLAPTHAYDILFFPDILKPHCFRKNWKDQMKKKPESYKIAELYDFYPQQCPALSLDIAAKNFRESTESLLLEASSSSELPCYLYSVRQLTQDWDKLIEKAKYIPSTYLSEYYEPSKRRNPKIYKTNYRKNKKLLVLNFDQLTHIINRGSLLKQKLESSPKLKTSVLPDGTEHPMSYKEYFEYCNRDLNLPQDTSQLCNDHKAKIKKFHALIKQEWDARVLLSK